MVASVPDATLCLQFGRIVNHIFIKSYLSINTTAAHPLQSHTPSSTYPIYSVYHTVALTQFIRSSLATTVKVLYKRIFLRSDNDQKHAQTLFYPSLKLLSLSEHRSTRRPPGSTVLLSSLRSLKQCSRIIQLLRSSPNKTTYLQHILKRHSHQSCINFRSRYKTEQAY